MQVPPPSPLPSAPTTLPPACLSSRAPWFHMRQRIKKPLPCYLEPLDKAKTEGEGASVSRTMSRYWRVMLPAPVTLLVVLVLGLVMAGVAGCGDDDSSDGKLDSTPTKLDGSESGAFRMRT